MFPLSVLEGLLFVMVMRLFPRRKTAILGTAGVVAGLVFFNKVLTSANSCSTTCADIETPSYAFLRRNEARMTVEDHPLISAVEVNYLPSNSPNEDRFVAGSSRELGAGLFAVLDGHSGYQCSEYLKEKLLGEVMKSLAANGLVTNPHVDLHPLNTSASNFNQNSTVHLSPPRFQGQNSLPSLEGPLKQAFLNLDKEISDSALRRMKMIQQGHSINQEGFKTDLMRAFAGACALLAVVTEKTLSVASTGDCRAVVGVREGGGGGGWSAVPMSIDQNAQNKEEVSRLKKAHPGEEGTVITMGRLLGSLMPLRSFGDVQYKWQMEEFDPIVQVPLFYLTPPYLTAEPVVTSRDLQGRDRFIVLATDGLWERMSSELVVRTVGEVLEPHQHSGLSSLFNGKQECCSENAATRLLWKGLGGEEQAVGRLLRAPAEQRRALRDDITIIVVHLRHNG